MYIVEENYDYHEPRFVHGEFKSESEAVDFIQSQVDDGCDPDNFRIIVEVEHKIKRKS